ncbi:MAG: helix-turn-helix transcriptional regulator [Planctomycetota bacterium]
MVAKVELDLADAGLDDRVDLWAEMVRPFYDFTPLRQDGAYDVSFARGWMLDGLYFNEVAHGAQVIRRSRRRHCTASPDILSLQYFMYGENDGEIGGAPMATRPGEVVIKDFSRGHQARCTPVHARSVAIPHDAVGYDPGRHPPTLRFGADTVVGHVLHHTIDAIIERLDQTTDAEAPKVAGGLLGLVRSLLFSDPAGAADTADFAAARRTAIRAHVDERIATERLTADMLSARFNVSRSTLYRDFKADGGLERFLRQRRLEAALMDLAFNPAERGAVTRVAERLGFATTAHFSRAFREQFGFAPSDVAGRCAHGEDAAAGSRAITASARRNAVEDVLKRL